MGNGFYLGGPLVVDSAGQLSIQALTDTGQGWATTILGWDGAGWQDRTANFSRVVDALKAGRISSNIPVAQLAVDGEDNLYAAGSYQYPDAQWISELPMGYVALWNKQTWTVLGQGIDQVHIYALAVSPTGKVYAAGEQPLTPEGYSSYIAQWDGEKWTQVNTSRLINSIQGIALDETGGLYAWGDSSASGDLIAYWHGTDWAIISDQMGGEAPGVRAMIVDKNGYLYIGGDFDSVGGVPARNIAYWDGSSWHPLGDGVNKPVEALALHPNGELYAVGSFTQAGGLPVSCAARWDGEAWHALGP